MSVYCKCVSFFDFHGWRIPISVRAHCRYSPKQNDRPKQFCFDRSGRTNAMCLHTSNCTHSCSTNAIFLNGCNDQRRIRNFFSAGFLIRNGNANGHLANGRTFKTTYYCVCHLKAITNGCGHGIAEPLVSDNWKLECKNIAREHFYDQTTQTVRHRSTDIIDIDINYQYTSRR